ncbi:MAG: putative baseplate assembly protein [Chloroflexota bacterium]
MPLTAPVLDDRSFQSIVDEAKKRIPQYTEEWTDHNVSDPGVTLIELFAWMTEMQIYRLNQVPRLHYIKFLNMLGMSMRGPVPAEAAVTFTLTAPQETAVLIPAGTEVSTIQTATENSVVFTTTDDFIVRPPEMALVGSAVATQKVNEKRFITHNLRHLENGFNDIQVFSALPQIDDALYFGFSNDLSHHILGLEMTWDPASGAGVDPTIPPLVWEAATGDPNRPWVECFVEQDTTQGLNQPGDVWVHLPRMLRTKLHEESLYWIRVRVTGISAEHQQQGMLPYETSPKLRQVRPLSWGGTGLSNHAQTINNELLGKSDGTPGQRFKLRMTPILTPQPGETLVVSMGGNREVWQQVADFSESSADDRHYTLDVVSGEVRFGPAIRQRDGSMQRYGAIPVRGANIEFQRYRTGGGLKGNVEADTLTILKTAIPFINRVTNMVPAAGGLDPESLDETLIRAPLAIRTRDRAMTAADFEYLAKEALPARVARVKCLQPRPSDVAQVAPGQVYVLVVPNTRFPAGYHDLAELQMDQEDLDTINSYLDDRRLLTTRLNVRAPAYRWVSVKVSLGALPGYDEGRVEQTVLEQLYRFLNPLTGGADGNGWPFGRDLFVSDVYQALQGMNGVAFIRNVELFLSTPAGEAVGDPMDNISVVTHGVIVSGVHQIEFLNQA